MRTMETMSFMQWATVRLRTKAAASAVTAGFHDEGDDGGHQNRMSKYTWVYRQKRHTEAVSNKKKNVIYLF